MALRLDMFVTPIESTTVTTAARPSGMAATARETATMKLSSTTLKLSPPARSICTANMTTQMPSTSQVRILESWLSLICSGVWPCSARASASAILPISVSMPVAVTTMVPRP